MPELDFSIEGAEVARYAATPLLKFKVRVSSSGEEDVANVALHCQVYIEAGRRRYVAGEQQGLLDLFGNPSASAKR